MMELKIVVDDSGRTNVTGPIDNIVIAYGLLEIARDMIRDHHAKKVATIAAPSPDDMLALRRAGHQ